MSGNGNPYAAGSGYTTTVSFADPAAGAAPQPDLIKDTTTKTFAADVIQESRQQTVLVDFWAPWCGPCKQLTPVLEKAVREAGGRVKLVKMNIDDHPTIAGQLGIQSIPAVIAFRDGQPVDGFMGAQPDSKIKEFIDRVAGPGGPGDQIAEALAVAAEALGQGDRQGAADVLAQILDFEPGNPAAVAMMGGMLVDAGDLAAAKALLETVPADKAKGEDIAGLAARITLAEEVAAIGDKGELLRRLDSDPKDHQARYDLAMILNAENDRTGAADNLLAIMKADRAWQDDGARRQLLKFFEAWGMTDEATLSARRKLSSLLFS